MRPAILLLSFVAAGPLAGQQVVVDNDAGAPRYQETLPWTTSGVTGYEGGTYRYRYSGDAVSTATWSPDLPASGPYVVSALFLRSSNRSVSVPYTVHHADGTSVVMVDQSGSGLAEVGLGTFEFSAGTGGAVELSTTGAAGYYIADAIRFRSLLNGAPPEVTGVRTSPPYPVADEECYATAFVTDDLDSVSTVSVSWRVHGETSAGIVLAADDGAHGDGLPGDGLFGAPMPAFPSGARVLFEFYADDGGNISSSLAHTYYVASSPGAGAGFIVVAGQSNACGPGELSASNEASDPRVVVCGNDYNWKVAYEPLNDATGGLDENALCPWTPTTVRGHSFGLRGAKSLLEPGRTMRMIPCARGGSSIAQWRKTSDPFDRSTLFGALNTRAHYAAPQGITAMWWYQGESNAGSSTFASDHTALMSDFRSELGTTLPILYAQLASHTSSGSNAAQHATGEVQRRLETGSGYQETLGVHHMVVTFDLPHYDHIHLSQAGVKELGRRFALATRQHVYGESVDGTGPRLQLAKPLVHPNGDRSLVQVRFTQPVNETSNDYGGQFRAYDSLGEVSVTSAERDPQAPEAVLLRLGSSPSGTVAVSYGNVPAPGLNTWVAGVVKGANDLPAPRFGPLPVEISPSGANGRNGYH